jgi:hypothetical protein
LSWRLAAVSAKDADGKPESRNGCGERLAAAVIKPDPDSIGFPMRNQYDLPGKQYRPANARCAPRNEWGGRQGMSKSNPERVSR